MDNNEGLIDHGQIFIIKVSNAEHKTSDKSLEK